MFHMGCLWMNTPQTFILMNGSITSFPIQFILFQHVPFFCFWRHLDFVGLIVPIQNYANC